jgi:hypothetical protein
MHDVNEKTRLATAEVRNSEAVKAQLDRILASPPFRNSRRCQSLLAYVVNTACDGQVEALKERVVGSSVFGRDPGYDTNQDAVVRNAAAEVRKRLAQYYLDPARETELRIELPSGSYLPEFRIPASAESLEPRHPINAVKQIRESWTPIALAIGGVLVAAVAFYVFTRFGPSNRPQLSELDRFWAPILSSPGVVQLCVGQSRFSYYPGHIPPATIPASKLQPMLDRFLYFGDALTMAKVSSFLTGHGKEVNYRGSLQTPYAELRGRPVVLIGAFNNDWTMRLTQGLRFSLERDDASGLRVIHDRERKGDSPWKMTRTGSNWDSDEDFAIVTRMFDHNMERWVVSAGGITHFGTMMTGDFLSTPAYFREAARSAPAGWEQKNMQIVLSTQVVGGTPGPPRVLATHIW